jgi:site-specific DNA-methyltransferase (adenine-specific)
MEPKLIHGDCLPVMRELAAESVDLIVTSPPYNLGIGYGTYRDTVPRDEYLRWTVEWCRTLLP